MASANQAKFANEKEDSNQTAATKRPAEALGLVPSLNANGAISHRASFAIPMEYPGHAARSLLKSNTSVFGNFLQGGFISILYAIGKSPLELWEKQVRSGHVKRITDIDIRSLAVEITNHYSPMTTFITTPIQTNQTLGIRLPIIVFVLKNMKRYFTFDVQILDSSSTRRRFRAAYSGPASSATNESTVLPLRLEEGWNQVSLNLADLTRRIYGTNFVEATRVQVFATTRLRRIYFCDKLFGEEEAPSDFKMYILNSNSTKP